MAIHVKIYNTPRPNDREGEALQHARVVSKGTRRMEDICEALVPMGLNTAQIKGILDGLVTYTRKSLQEGYHIELEELGTFSLSVRSKQILNSSEEPATEVTIDGVNFRVNPILKKKIRKAAKIEVYPEEGKPAGYSQVQRKSRMLKHLAKNGNINGLEYTRLNDCTRYTAQKDLNSFLEEKIITQVGKGTRKMFVLAT